MLKQEPFIIIILAVIFGVILFQLLSKVLPGIYSYYKKNYVIQIEQGMNSIFIFETFDRYFKYHLSVIFLLMISGYIVYGAFGAVLGITISILLPSFYLKRIRQKRTSNFIIQLPDVLTSIASSLRAGSNLARAIDQVTLQQPDPAAQEFRLVLSEYKMGKSIDDALKDLSIRISCHEVDLMVSAVSLSRGVGGNLATTLDVLSDTVRKKSHMEGKIQALTAMGRMQGWVVGLIPVAVLLIMRLQEPEGMKLLFSEPVGWMVLMIISLMGLLAAFMIKKIVKIDI